MPEFDEKCLLWYMFWEVLVLYYYVLFVCLFKFNESTIQIVLNGSLQFTVAEMTTADLQGDFQLPVWDHFDLILRSHIYKL